MTDTVEEPSQAQKAEAVAEAGPGADINAHVANVNGEHVNFENEKNNNGTSASSSNSSDLVAEPKMQQPQAPQRSKWKTVLIMASLCVSHSHCRSETTGKYSDRCCADCCFPCRH